MFCLDKLYLYVLLRSLCILLQKEDLRRVMEMLSVREQHARTLLIYHRWDVEKLFAVYVDKGKAFLFGEAGVSVDQHPDSDSSVPSTVMCYICMEDVARVETTRMDCGHCFCNSCEYLFGYTRLLVLHNDGNSCKLHL